MDMDNVTLIRVTTGAYVVAVWLPFLIVMWRAPRHAGLSPVSFFIPVANAVVVWMVACRRWQRQKPRVLNSGARSEPATGAAGD